MSTSARDEILARVRSATADITTEPRTPATSRSAEGRGSAGGRHQSEVAGTLDLFAENVADYRAEVLRVPTAEVGATIAQALRAAGQQSVVIPTGLDDSWREALGEGFRVVPEAEATAAETLDGIDAVVTGSAIGIATTGTIVLDHQADQGRRELTLVPDCHVCVIRDDQVVHDVPEAVSRLRTPSGHQRALTWISGPSATSDIELQRVEGVHGPRTLIVVIASDVGDVSDVGVGDSHTDARPTQD